MPETLNQIVQDVVPIRESFLQRLSKKAQLRWADVSSETVCSLCFNFEKEKTVFAALNLI